MKYDDIPKFTKRDHYHINVALAEVPYMIERYIEHYSLETNPDFQRGHVWTGLQQTKYIEFLLAGGSSGQDIYFNHPYWMRDMKDSMVLVDGLQRITSILMFMDNKIKAYGHYYSEYDYIPYDIGLIFHVNCLKTRAEVLSWYIQLNEGGVVHTPEEINRVKKLLEQTI
jgi:hypothetical protein